MRFLQRKPGARGFCALLLAALFVLLPACGSDGSTQSASSAAATEPVFDEADTLTVYIGGQDSGVDYMTKLVQDAGFHLLFKTYTTKADQLFLKGSAESSSIYICNIGTGTRAIDEGLLEDHYDTVCKARPDYVQRTGLINPEGTAFLLPVDFNGYQVAQPAVLVRTDLYNEYGKEIRSAQDYEGLLKWLKKKDPDTVPGLVAAPWADQSYGAQSGYMALNLFLPGMGYTSLAGLCLQETGATNFLWMDKDGVAHAFYDLADAQTAIKDFLTWKREAMVDFGSGTDDPEYPTVLVNALGDDLPKLDKTLYTYNVFSEPAVQYPSVTMVAMPGPNTDVTEFVRFMDWMQDIDHYKYVMYGVEDVDYKWDGQYITDNGISDYNDCYQRTVFNRPDFSYQLFDHSLFLPTEYTEESTASESTAFPLSWQTRYELGKKLNSDSEYQNFVSYVHKTMISMFTTLYATDDSTLQNQKIQETFEAIQRVNAANTATDLVNEALGKQ